MNASHSARRAVEINILERRDHHAVPELRAGADEQALLLMLKWLPGTDPGVQPLVVISKVLAELERPRGQYFLQTSFRYHLSSRRVPPHRHNARPVRDHGSARSWRPAFAAATAWLAEADPEDAMIGRTFGPYRVLDKIGAGGMGEVYRARDTRLDRDVALKVLPAASTTTSDRLARFEREAKVLASLNHPNIVTIHSIEQSGDTRFLTMELVDGEPLDRVIPAIGLPLVRLLAIAGSIAEACAAAHDKGVIHRDLKPANVMVDARGRVKVLDFGIAKLADTGESAAAATMLALTSEGVVVGSAPYMSPEQIEGLPIDHRSDIFSLGVLLYEMATGARPFTGATSAAVMSSILRDTPRPVEDARRDLPPALGGLVQRCLAKVPGDRVQTAHDLARELRVVTDASSGAASDSGAAGHDTGADAPWIAVLPFTHVGSSTELGAFAAGLADDVNTGLSRFSYLMVLAHGAVRALDDRPDPGAARRLLGARYVVDGSVRQSGATIRVTVRLVDADTGTQLWSETFNRDLSAADLFATQDEISERVVATVADAHGVLVRSMAGPLRERAPERLTPYEAVLRFFLFQQRRSPPDHLVTRDALERAVERKPFYADAWAGVTTVYVDEHRHLFNPRPDPLDRALAAARRAVDAAPANQLAHAALAEACYFRQDVGGFRAAAERAIALNPGDSATLGQLGLWMGYAGDWSRARELTNRAYALNPHAPGWYRYAAFFDHYRRGEYSEALAAAERLNTPEYFTTHTALAAAHAQLGNQAAARAAAAEVLRLAPTYPESGQLLFERFVFTQPDLVEHFVDGLRKAGLAMR